MRALIKLTLVLILLSPLAVAAIAWFALSDAALVDERVSLSHADIARAKTILKQNDPRNLPPGTQRTIELGQQDLNLAANYLLQKLAKGSARLALAKDRLQLMATVQIPYLPWRNFLNVDTTVDTGGGQPKVTRLRLGQLNIPGPLATLIARKILTHVYDSTQLESAAGLARHLQLSPDRLLVTYQWDPVLVDQARDTLLTGGDREALGVYLDLLLDLQSRGIGKNGSLTQLLQPMFTKAMERSRQENPVAENISLLTVLGTWASGQDISRLVPGRPRRPSPFRLKLEGRKDFAQHFLASAALAARGDSTLSDAVGLFKEISDTDNGSGFSFTDIAADRAGSRFGELATSSEQEARRVQQRLAAGVVETDIMPLARDLPEHLRGEAFRQRFGHVGSPAYQQAMDEIERRISACSLYQN